MKKIFIFLLFILFFNTVSAKASDYLSACNTAIDRLKDYGFNFSKFTQSDSKTMITGYYGLGCGYPPNSENMIAIMTSPIRIFVYDAYSLSKGYCVMLTTGQVFKTIIDKC